MLHRDRRRCCGAGCGATSVERSCSASACCSASRARRSRSACRWRAAGTRRATRASRWASPAPATPAPSPARCSRRGSPSTSAGTRRWASRSIPAVLVLVAFRLLAKEPPAPARRASRSAPSREMLREGDTWRLCGLYAVTFGGFVGLSSFLPIFFHDQYGLSKVDAASLAAVGGARGSLRAPVRRPPRRPLRRHARADRSSTASPRRCCSSLARLPALAAAAVGFPLVDGHARPRQRRDVPARRPALPRADRRRHRPRRRGRRPRRLHAADRARRRCTTASAATAPG